MTTPVMTPRVGREQRAFRALMDGMARPGSVQTVGPDAPSSRVGAALLLFEALLDHEVTFAVVPADAEIDEWLLRSTGSRIASVRAADYLLASGEGIESAIRQAKVGLPAYPDLGATVVAAVESVSGEAVSGVALVLAGPGIRDQATVWVAGLPAETRDAFMERNSEVPLGVDLVLIAPDGRFTCLPRYTRIQEGN